jgi:hypothetical protein
MKSFMLSTCALGYAVAEVGLVASSSKAHYFIYYFFIMIVACHTLEPTAAQVRQCSRDFNC